MAKLLSTLRIDVLPISWDWETDDYYSSKRTPYICLGCFLQGIIRRVTSPRFLCVKHGARYRDWRKRKGLPPIAGNGPKRRRGAVGDTRKEQIVAALKGGPATASEIAAAVGMKGDAVKVYLYKMRDAGQVVCLGAGPRRRSGAGRHGCVWQLVGEE